MSSFVELCESRDGLDNAAARRRAAVVEHIAFGNPADDGAPTYLVGVQGDRVVAHLGRMPTRFYVNNAIETGSYFHDLYVHPDIRKLGGQGFFLSMKLYQAAEDASPGFVALIWTNEINIALQQARKYDQLWTDRCVKILSLDQRIDRLAPRLVAAAIKPVARALIGSLDTVRALLNRRQGTVQKLDQFDVNFDEFAQRTAPQAGIAPYKDSAYLNWKYVTRPALSVAIFSASDENDELSGYVVVVDPDPTYKAAAIAELVAVNNDPGTIRNLLDTAVSHARLQGAQRIAAVATRVEYSSALRSRLFFPRGRRDPLFFALADRSPNKNLILDTKNWHMSLGDSEGPF